MAEPVTIYAEDPRVPRTLMRALQLRRQSFVDGLLSGGAKDYAEYREYVGKIIAFDEAIGICQQTETDLSGN